MSDDLISRKALLEVLNKRLADYSCDSNSGAQRIADIYKYELIPVVENAPTAFDKEKVIEKLKRLEKDTFDYYNRYNDEMAFEKVLHLDQRLRLSRRAGKQRTLLSSGRFMKS